MRNILAKRFSGFVELSDDDISFLENIEQRATEVVARTDIIREGDVPSNVHLVVEGFACRYKMLKSGERQIVGYLAPGDFCDLHVFILKHMDHSITALVRCRVVEISRETVLAMLQRTAIAQALWLVSLVDEATLREALLNVGRRTPVKRIAHFLYEMLLRLRVVGLAREDGYDLPITQNDLADTMGLSVVHTNRSLQQLRSEGLIRLKGKQLSVPDEHRLRTFAGFNANYLHLEGTKPS